MFSNETDEYRNKVVHVCNEELSDIILSRNIEKYIYNKAIEIAKDKRIYRSWNNIMFKEIYLSMMIRIYTNIQGDYNPEFKKKIVNGSISTDTLPDMSVYDIYPEKWVHLLDIKLKRDKIKYEQKAQAMTDQFKCRKCNGRSCSYYEVQTRSADEPMTQFICCLDCGNMWKQ